MRRCPIDESEWLSSADPSAMLRLVTPDCDCDVLLSPTSPVASNGRHWPGCRHANDRKLRLFACGCARLRGCIDVSNYEDGTTHEPSDEYSWGQYAREELELLLRHKREPVKAAALVRDIFGNPFSHITIDPAWITPDVRMLAEAAYEERMQDGTLDLARLAVLSDALEESGCDGTPEETKKATVYVQNHGEGWYVMVGIPSGARIVERATSRRHAVRYAEETFRVKKWQTKKSRKDRPETESPCWGDGLVTTPAMPNPVLAHLRSIGPHVRGCWAVDLILDKS